jgi:hypothetical protein
VVRLYLSPVGRAQNCPKRSNNFLLFAAPASLIGSELSVYLAPTLRLPRHDAARLPLRGTSQNVGSAKPTLPLPPPCWYQSTDLQ